MFTVRFFPFFSDMAKVAFRSSQDADLPAKTAAMNLKVCDWVCTERNEEGDCSKWEWQCKKAGKSTENQSCAATTSKYERLLVYFSGY